MKRGQCLRHGLSAHLWDSHGVRLYRRLDDILWGRLSGRLYGRLYGPLRDYLAQPKEEK